jgi:hypothetical protein
MAWQCYLDCGRLTRWFGGLVGVASRLSDVRIEPASYCGFRAIAAREPWTSSIWGDWKTAIYLRFCIVGRSGLNH